MDNETVDLIATDPPFNKGRDFHAMPTSLAAGAKFQDRWSWKEDVQQEWVDQISDDYPRLMEAIESARYAHSDGMGAFMCFMAVRLLEMRRVLKPTGSIYLHCDPTASHYLKACMDAIFGWRNFVNEIVWHYRKWTAGKYTFQRNHDIILFYAKEPTRKRTFNQLFMDRAASTLRRFGTEKIVSGHDASGKRIPSTVSGESEGVRQDDVWDFNRVAPVKQIYPTEKPIKLYERIIRASSNPEDMVLDPFAGCATTCVAAERLGRQWVGIDIWEKAHEVVIKRLKVEGLLTDSQSNGGHLSFGDIHYATKPPERTDSGEIAAPFLQVTEKRKRPPLEGWQKLSRAQIVQELTEAQSINEGLVLCAGCGRELEAPFMELDHIQPRADRGENDISNRILLCRPCNGRKSAKLTMKGLMGENRKADWMKDERLATQARDLAQERYEDIRYRRHWPAVTGDLFDGF